MKRVASRAAAIAGVVVAVVAYPRAVTPARADTTTARDCGFEAGPTRAVAEVLDGDTFRLDDGKEVRLIGLIAPRAEDAGAARGAWPPEEESRRALARLLQGRSVSLAFAGPRADRYGRVLAHALLVAEGGTATQWVQALHLQAGQARAFAAPGQDACIGQLMLAEQAARQTRLGLWSNAAYQVRPADRPSELERFRGTYQIVSGRIAKAGGTRGLVTLDLVSSETERPATAGSPGTPFRRTARVVWRRDLRGILDAAGGGPNSLAGADIEVRGWIDVRGGPEIELLGASQITITSAQKNKRPAE